MAVCIQLDRVRCFSGDDAVLHSSTRASRSLRHGEYIILSQLMCAHKHACMHDFTHSSVRIYGCRGNQNIEIAHFLVNYNLRSHQLKSEVDMKKAKLLKNVFQAKVLDFSGTFSP